MENYYIYGQKDYHLGILKDEFLASASELNEEVFEYLYNKVYLGRYVKIKLVNYKENTESILTLEPLFDNHNKRLNEETMDYVRTVLTREDFEKVYNKKEWDVLYMNKVKLN